MTAQTSEKLAKALDAVKLDGLAARARNDEFHDFLSPHAMPEMMLVNALHAAALGCPDGDRATAMLVLRQAVINGDFDATSEESDEWARSPEGQEAFNMLVRGK